MKRNPFETLPDTVEVGGCVYRINADFRVGVALETEMHSADPDAAGLLTLFYPEGIPEDVQAAADKLLWFYACPEGAQDDDDPPAVQRSARLYDFVQDADALTASFQQAYGIDLERDRLHWWKFRRLMFGLPPETPFMQVGKDLVQGLINGISEKIDVLKKKAGEIANTVTDKITGLFKTHSPSRVMIQIGKYVGQGLAIGMEARKKLVGKTAAGVASAVTKEVSRLNDEIEQITEKQQARQAAEELGGGAYCEDGLENTGGGGGGGGYNTSQLGGSGGSGIIMVRWRNKA